MYVADVACRALVTVSSSAAAGTAPAESGITVGMRAPVKYKVESHFASPAALRPDKGRLDVKIVSLLMLQAELSRVKMSENLHQT